MGGESVANKTENFLFDAIIPRVERIGWLLALVGLVAKYYLFATADTLLIVGVGTLATAYFLQAYAPHSAALASPEMAEAGFFSEQQAISPPFLSIVATKVIGIGSAPTLLGILFKLLFWKGATSMLLVGVFSLFIALALLANGGQFSRKGFIILTLGVGAIITPTEILVRQFYRDDPALVEKMIFQHQHPHDKAAQAEITRLLAVRHHR